MSGSCRTPATADCPAPESCLAFQHSVRTATKRAISFIEGFYNLTTTIRVPPVQGSCTEYTGKLKKLLSSDLVSCLAGNSIQGVDELEALSFSASTASIPKSWPQCCDCMKDGLEEELKRRLTKEKVQLPAGYLEFVRQKVLEVFPKGIRKAEFERHARRVTPPYSSTTEATRNEGGSYSSWNGTREDYLSNWEKPEVLHRPEFMVANAPGKPRPLVKNSSSYLRLRPLHTAIYDRLSKQKWLLRGPPRRRKFLDAGFETGRTYLSADFTAATDNLPIEVAEMIIDTLAWRSSPTVLPILAEARRSLRPTISFPTGNIEPTTGQLMGNLLSFPLLCLQNWIASCWTDEVMACGETPKLINGDDLVAQVSKEWVETYKKLSPSLGFSLNEKKTSYSRSPNVNSTYFTSNFKLIPYVRAAGLSTRDPRDVGNIMSDILRPFESARSNKCRSLVHCLSIYFSKLIRKSGKTLHSLDFRVRREQHLYLTRSIRKREKERSGWDYKPPKRLRHPMGMDLVKSEDPYGVHDDKEVAEAVVKSHWDAGPWIKPEKERLRDVYKILSEEKMTRHRRLGMRSTLRRLLKDKREKLVWIPSKLADCYDLSHETAFLSPDLTIEWISCEVCDRVRDVIEKKKKTKEKDDEMEFLQIQFSAIKEGIRIGAT